MGARLTPRRQQLSARGPRRLAATIGACLPTVILGMLLLGMASLIGRARADDSERGPVPAKQCTTHTLETPYRGYGYDHVVTLKNTCDHVERCVIESPSNPDPQRVDVPAGGERSVVLRRGSPAREFTAEVTCKKG